MPLLQTTTAEGALKGMILGRAPHELQDQEAAYLQDLIVSQPGFLDRRGAIQGATSLGNNFNGKRPAAIGGCYDPSGNYRILVAYWDVSTAYFVCCAVFDSSFTYLGHFDVGLASFNKGGPGPGSGETGYGAAAGPILITPSIDGGLLLSASIDYSSGVLPSGNYRDSFVCHWWGGYSSVFGAAGSPIVNVTMVTTDELTTISGASGEIAKLKPGIVIIGQGIVKSIDTATTATLAAPAQGLTNAVAGSGTSIARPICAVDAVWPVRTRGRISTAPGVATATEVTGFGTRFVEMTAPDLAAPPRVTLWVLRDPNSGQLISYRTAGGVLTDVLNDTRLILGTTLQSRALAPYLLMARQTVYSGPASNQSQVWGSYAKGWITWQLPGGYQAYGNSAEVNGSPTNPTGAIKAPGRVWIGGPNMHNEMDHSRDDGNWFDVPSTKDGDTKVHAGLNDVVCTANAAYKVHGTAPEDYYLEKICDDGALCATAITAWQGTTIWLGRKGIWMFDGANPPVNLVRESLSLEWQKRVAAFQTEDNTTKDASSYPINRAYVFVYRDHLFVNVQNTGSTHVVYTDGTAKVVNPMQLMIYLPNQALSFLTNFNFVGFITNIPTKQQEGYALLIQDSSTTHYLYPMSNFFTQGVGTTDAIVTANATLPSGTTPGPWAHVESRKFDAGDGLWKKAWKQLAIEFNETSTKKMWLETVPGLNTTGTRALLPYTGSGLWGAARVKFRTRDQYMSFRLYEDIATRPATLRIGAWQWGYKFARRGAV